MGNDFSLIVVESNDSKRTRCVFSEKRFFVQTPPGTDFECAEAVRRAMFKWYKSEAKTDIAKRVAAWAPVVGKSPTSVSIRNQKSRWGSCSFKGSVNFNWRLIMAPPEVIDYVVVHELCHLAEHNHSAAYWSLVAKILPDYKTRRKQLRDLGHLLEIT